MNDTTLASQRRSQQQHRSRDWRNILLAWIPVIVFMALIFVFSAQPKTAPPDGDAVYFSGVMPIFTAGDWDLIIKKASHILGYGLLAALLMHALWRSVDRNARTIAYSALLITLVYALTDELHQAFVPGRNASLLDIGFDYIGAACATLIGRRVLSRHQDRSSTP